MQLEVDQQLSAAQAAPKSIPFIGPILGLVGSIFGGGKSAAPAGPAVAGDATAGLDAPFQYNGQFTVGGSGNVKADSTATQDNAKSALSNNALIGIGVVIGFLGLVWLIKKK